MEAGGGLLLQKDPENEGPTEQEHERLNQPPDPTDGGTDVALLEIAPYELEEQAAPLYQIP